MELEAIPEILILNHSQNETVCYPLVLIEGVISNNAETAVLGVHYKCLLQKHQKTWNQKEVINFKFWTQHPSRIHLKYT